MAQLPQGQRITLPITATQGYYFSTSGAAIVRVTPSNGGAFVVTIGTNETDVGWYGFPASLELVAQSGVLTYNTTPSALTAVQLGDQRDSDPVDVALAANGLIYGVSALQGALNFSNVVLFGDSISAQNSFATPTGLSMSIAAGVATVTMPNHQMAAGWSFRINKTNYSLINDTNFGVYQVASVISANQFTFIAPAGAVDGAYSVAEICNTNKTPFSAYFNAYNSINGEAFRLSAICARSGDSTLEMLARIDEISTYGGYTVFVLGGTNDAIRAQSLADSKLNISLIVNKISSFGCRVVILTIPPVSSAVPLQGGQTATQRAQWVAEYNDHIKSLASSGSVTVVDIYSALVDKTSATANFVSTMTYDGVHLSPLGCVTVAPLLQAALNQRKLPRVSSNLQTANQLLPNPLFIGTGGTANAGITGTIAAGKSCQRTGAATAVGSLVARSDGNGNAQQLVVTAAADERIIYDEPSILGSVSAGDIIKFSTTINAVAWANVRTISVQLIMTVGGINFIANSAFNNQPGFTTAPFTGVTGDVRFSTEAVPVPAGVTAILTRIDTTFSSGTTVSYSESQVVKL